MPLAEQIPQYPIMSLAAPSYRHATPLGSVFTMSIAKKKGGYLVRQPPFLKGVLP